MDDKSKSIEELLKKVNFTRLHIEEAKVLIETFQALWDEVDQRNTIMDLDPDYELYKTLEDSNMWFMYAVEYEGKYSVYSFMIQPSLHVKGKKQLVSDFIYVDPSHRGTGIADILILASEDAGRREGADISLVTLKSFDRHDSLVGRLGYDLYENSFQKVI